jgi:hypothetical protein
MIRRSCETCPLVIGCDEISAVYKDSIASWEEHAAREEELPGRVIQFSREVGIALDEKINELTYDITSKLDDETAQARSAERNQRKRDDEKFEEIVLYGTSGARVNLIRAIQTALNNVVEASDNYAVELQNNCSKGVGKIKSYGIIGTKYSFCRSGNISPNTSDFTTSEVYKELTNKVDEANAELMDSYDSVDY